MACGLRHLTHELPDVSVFCPLPAALVLRRRAVAAEAGPAPAPPPPTVSVVDVTPETVPVSSEWIATLDGFVNAQIRPQVSGYLVADALPRRRAGARRARCSSRSMRARSRRSLAQAEAQLAQAQAELGRAERDVARDTPLAKERAIPQSQLDNDIQAQARGAGRR